MTPTEFMPLMTNNIKLPLTENTCCLSQNLLIHGRSWQTCIMPQKVNNAVQ